ncbi:MULTISPECIES: ABC transporter substrate-binding protein [unclassified Mesorhizobium]|uniref:ABC transporter substrate-binding protein n=1 Tax=unclassified Mesorhizobium TaxID=325217 RepID=UPI0011268C5A|nr:MULTISPECIES: ABC transporter substrate-binding protein [unclassified Mesorhizobium]MBZ9958905.1 ABC transporter substrate-binding protein [Mesorhizobium sp. BR1-1-14]TPK68819.1 ABC transporter substrate-binding protein [Mesorhizobium sp. B2-5-1]TPM20987.1 ABC transporter substrate-binding protein [Mesorhizobium sp. B2-3-6]TPM58047.1 ABC transporter substrate-binding protein [Mesorhizobium sp. B2-1-9]TPM85000.1 ABC transporter substrate-binding protein [Mesorhizobium sp. B2-1-4]
MTITRRSLLLRAPLAAGIIAVGLPSIARSQAASVKIRYLASRGSISPHELADQLGYFKGLGIELENVGYAGGGPESLFALASGSVDLGSAATPAVINSIAGGNDFVAAYPSNGINSQVKSVFYVLEDSPIRSIADVAGKTISVNTLGAHLDYAVREALHSVGLPPDAAKLVVVPGPQLEQTLRSHQVDVAGLGYWQATFAGALVANGGVRGVFNDADVLGEIAGGFIVLRRDFIAANRDAAKNLVEQSARAADWSRQNPDEARKVLAEILDKRGENGELARYWTGFGLREKAVATDRDIDFWVAVLERDGRLPKGKLKAADILYRPGESKTN